MAFVVGIPSIIAEEGHAVLGMDVLWMCLHELLDAVPECGYRLDIFVQTQHETVFLAVVDHESEGVVVNIAEQFNGWLHPPVVFKLHHQLMTEEEPTLESAHVAIGDGIAVDDLPLSHILSHSCGLLLIDPGWERPMLFRDLAVMRLPRHERGGDTLEFLVEGLVVEEDPVVVVVAVEAIFDLADGPGDFPEIRVAGQCHKGGINALAGCWGR
jgi:hypothetical protein